MLRNLIGQMLDVYVNNGDILNYEVTNNKVEGRDVEIFMKNDLKNMILIDLIFLRIYIKNLIKILYLTYKIF